MRYFINIKSYFTVYVLLMLFAVTSSVFAQTNPNYFKITSSKLNKDSILVGDRVVWSTIFTIPSDKEIAIAVYGDILKQDTSKLEVLNEFKLDTISIKGGLSQLEAKLLFTSFDSGYFKLPQPLIITGNRGLTQHTPDGKISVGIGGDTIHFNTPSLYVNTVQIDTATFKMYDIKGQIKYPITFKEVVPWILLALLIMAIIYLIYRYIKYRKENKDFFGKPIIKDPPHIIALRELDKLRIQKLWQAGKEKQFYTGITDTLRSYIEGRYGVSAMEKTSNEIMNSLIDKKIEAKSYNEINELFKLADLVKFAKYSPIEAENEDAIPIAVRFVNSTFMQEMEQEKKEEGK
ncbi:MAG: hypothetical protein RR919_01365 [Bacteroidales bacterium]